MFFTLTGQKAEKINDAVQDLAATLNVPVEILERWIWEKTQDQYDVEDIEYWLQEHGYQYDQDDINHIAEVYRDRYDANLGTWDNIAAAYSHTGLHLPEIK